MIPHFKTLRFTGPIRQRGGGFGQLFSRIAHWLVPLVKKAAPTIKNTIIEAGKTALKDPALSEAFKDVHKNLMAKGTKEASRLLTGVTPNDDTENKKTTKASQKIINAVSNRKSVGPLVILPKATKIMGGKRKGAFTLGAPPGQKKQKKTTKKKKIVGKRFNKSLF